MSETSTQSQKAECRVNRLTAHFVASSDSPTEKGFEPGRLLLNKVAIITGAGSGIGKATAILFAHHGAYVALSDIDVAAAQSTADFIRNSAGDRCIVVPGNGDVTSDSFPERVVQAAASTWGSIHILVLNAGFTWDGVVHKMSQKQWDAMLSVHCTAPFRLIQAAAPYMRDAAKQEIERYGKPASRCIITVSSVSGAHGNAGQINYATAKSGVLGMTKALAKEWGPFGVRANAVVFGHISTRLVADKEAGHSIEYGGEKVKLGIPQSAALTTSNLIKFAIPLGRAGTAEEAAGSMLLLASPYASYITGHALEVTGGGWM